jgi:hypothetical protein
VARSQAQEWADSPVARRGESCDCAASDRGLNLRGSNSYRTAVSAGHSVARKQFGSPNDQRTTIPNTNVPIPVKTPTFGVLNSVRRFAAHSQSVSVERSLNISATPRIRTRPQLSRQDMLDHYGG